MVAARQRNGIADGRDQDRGLVNDVAEGAFLFRATCGWPAATPARSVTTVTELEGGETLQ
jgi:hypothetical protein